MKASPTAIWLRGSKRTKGFVRSTWTCASTSARSSASLNRSVLLSRLILVSVPWLSSCQLIHSPCCIAHYKKYFQAIDTTSNNEKAVVFQKLESKSAGTSYMDSLFLEISFPNPRYPSQVLYSLLHDAIDEAPKEARRFPQKLYDALGDHSVCNHFVTALNGLTIV
jgi:hypothetical protein